MPDLGAGIGVGVGDWLSCSYVLRIVSCYNNGHVPLAQCPCGLQQSLNFPAAACCAFPFTILSVA